MCEIAQSTLMIQLVIVMQRIILVTVLKMGIDVIEIGTRQNKNRKKMDGILLEK